MANGGAARGLFIAFEGGEGSGKSTQAKLLAQRLAAGGADVVHTREPGGSPLAEGIRSLLVGTGVDAPSPMTEMLLFAAARRAHVDAVIGPALERGAVVICDRYVGSTLAYQGQGRGLNDSAIRQVHMVSGVCNPDLTVWLDIDWRVGLARALIRLRDEGSGEGRFESFDDAFHARVAEGFLRQYREGSQPWVRVDANGTESAVHERVMRLVRGYCGLRDLVPAA